MIALASEQYYLEDSSYDISKPVLQPTARGTGRSVLAEGYEDRSRDSTSTAIVQLCLEDANTSKYQGLKSLIEEWLNEPGDYDITVWPEIEQQLKSQKINFRDTFE